MLASWVRDVRHAARGLLRNPGFSLVVVLTLGVGVGANAAVFSFVNAVLLRPLPYVEADRLVAVQETSPPAPFLVTPGDYVDWKERNEVFETLSGYLYSVSGLTTPAGDAELLYTVAVSSDYFRALRARPLLGRTFLPGEDRAGRDGVAVISHGLWTRRFGGEPDIVGREMALDGRPRTVIGVMPPEFEFPPGGRDVWTPLVLTEADRNDRRNHSVVTVGRLRPGVTFEQARVRMAALGDRLAEAAPRAVLAAVVGQGLATAAIGLCIGVLAAMATTRLFAGLLFGTSADSTAVTALVSSLVFAAVLVACWLPARLAVRVDPVRALRAD